MSDSMSCLSSLSLSSNNSREDSWSLHIRDRNFSPCLSPSRHLEVELWRRNQSISSRHSEFSISTLNNHPNTSPPSPTFPSSPSAFRLDPPLSSLGSHDRPPISAPHRSDHRPDLAHPHDLDRLRLAALTELQRSVVETGEGFVDKMRDWETHRQREPMIHRGLKRSLSMMACRTPDPMDDSDDVMNLDSAEEVQFWGPRKKRTLSIGGVDGMDVIPLEETSSTTDDTESCGRDSMSAIPFPNAPLLPKTPSSSHSDKAVSTLTLAFASGACSINDYQPVLDAHNHTLAHHYGEESHVGELWG